MQRSVSITTPSTTAVLCQNMDSPPPMPISRTRSNERGGKRSVSIPHRGIALIVREFFSNLPHMDGFSVYVHGKWVQFDVATINRAYSLRDNDSDAYRALFQSPNYDLLLQSLSYGREPWKKKPQKSEVTTFPRAVLKPVPRAWFYFLCALLIPSLHVSTV